MPKRFSPKIPRLRSAHGLLVLVLLAFLLRVLPLTFSHYWDETVYLQNAMVLLEGRQNYSEFFYRPPLLSIFFAAGFLIWDHIYVANFVEGSLTTLVVVFAYLFSRRVYSAGVALTCAALFTFSPFFVKLGHDLMTGLPAVSLMMGSMALLVRRTRTCLVLAGVLFSLSVLMRFTSAFLGLYVVLFSLAFRVRLGELFLFGMGSFLTFLPYGVWAQLEYGFFLDPLIRGRRIIMLYSAHVSPRIYLRAWIDIFPWIVLIGSSAALLRFVAAVSAQMRGVRTAGQRAVARLDDRLKHEAILILWSALFFAYMSTIPHKETRYLVPISLGVMPLAAAGLAALWARTRRLKTSFRLQVALACAILLSLDFYPTVARVRLPLVDDSVGPDVEVAQYLNEVAAESDTLYAVTNFPVLAFYTARPTVSLLPVQTEFYERWPEYMAAPGFYVYYVGDEERGLVPERAFLDSNPRFEKLRESEHAIVYKYTTARNSGGKAGFPAGEGG